MGEESYRISTSTMGSPRAGKMMPPALVRSRSDNFDSSILEDASILPSTDPFCTVCSTVSTARRRVSRLSKIDLNVVGHSICPYLDTVTDLSSLAATSKDFQLFIYGMESLWVSRPTDICIDSTCRFGCGRTKCLSWNAWSILSNAPIRHLRMHLSFSLFGVLWKSVSKKATIRRLHLRFRADAKQKMDAESIKRLIQHTCTEVPNLTHLTIFGWPTHINSSATESTEVCVKWLQRIGANLKSLQFLESSPRGILASALSICPRLEHFVVEGRQDLSSRRQRSSVNRMESGAAVAADDGGEQEVTVSETASAAGAPEGSSMILRSDNLRVLGLQNIGTRIAERMQLTNLMTLEYIELESGHYFWKDAAEVVAAINALPRSITDFEFRIPGTYANQALQAIGRRLNKLRNLTLQIPDAGSTFVPPDIAASSVSVLRDGCPQLMSLELVDGLTGFDNAAFQQFASFPKLRRLKLLYDETLVDLLPGVLFTSNSIEQVFFYENAGDIFQEDGGVDRWTSMEEKLQRVSEQFSSVLIGLTDAWWT